MTWLSYISSEVTAFIGIVTLWSRNVRGFLLCISCSKHMLLLLLLQPLLLSTFFNGWIKHLARWTVVEFFLLMIGHHECYCLNFLAQLWVSFPSKPWKDDFLLIYCVQLVILSKLQWKDHLDCVKEAGFFVMMKNWLQKICKHFFMTAHPSISPVAVCLWHAPPLLFYDRWYLTSVVVLDNASKIVFA